MLNPNIDNRLKCDVDGHPSTYNWTCSDRCEDIANESLSLPQRCYVDGDTDVFTCIAFMNCKSSVI